MFEYQVCFWDEANMVIRNFAILDNAIDCYEDALNNPALCGGDFSSLDTGEVFAYFSRTKEGGGTKTEAWYAD